MSSAGGDAEKVFDKFDANGDGKISEHELRAIMSALGSEISEEEVSRVMSEIDKNCDGFIDMNEFKCFYGGDGDGGVDKNEELKEAFRLYDRDGNGLISVKELHSVLKSLGEKCSVKDCNRMIQSVDADGDGHVNFEEFRKMMSRE